MSHHTQGKASAITHTLGRQLYLKALACCTVLLFAGTATLSFGAELFPYSPPSMTQQRPMVQRPESTPELTAEERARIEELSTQAKKLSTTEQQQVKDLLKKNLVSAARNKNWAQAQYFSEALRQLE